MEEFKTRVKNENDMEAWESSEAYDVSLRKYYYLSTRRD